MDLGQAVTAVLNQTVTNHLRPFAPPPDAVGPLYSAASKRNSTPYFMNRMLVSIERAPRDP